MLKARVILIFKKGNTNLFENYRPISLLNTLYKIFATITQIRIANQVDKHLQKNTILIQEKQKHSRRNIPSQKSCGIR